MDIVDSVINFFTNKQENQQVPEESCPNCWGYQEFGDKLFADDEREKNRFE